MRSKPENIFLIRYKHSYTCKKNIFKLIKCIFVKVYTIKKEVDSCKYFNLET